MAIWLLIAALSAVMGVWFEALRYVRAGYLVRLGIKLLRSRGDLAAALDRARPNGSLFLQGFVVILSNPKMLVLFGALIPPFLRNGGNAGQETLVLGVTFAIIAAVSDNLSALAVGRAGAWMTRSRTRAVEITRGACLTVGAAWTALRGR